MDDGADDAVADELERAPIEVDGDLVADAVGDVGSPVVERQCPAVVVEADRRGWVDQIGVAIEIDGGAGHHRGRAGQYDLAEQHVGCPRVGLCSGKDQVVVPPLVQVAMYARGIADDATDGQSRRTAAGHIDRVDERIGVEVDVARPRGRSCLHQEGPGRLQGVAVLRNRSVVGIDVQLFGPISPLPWPLSVSSSPAYVPELTTSEAPLATVVPPAIVPNALALLTFRLPERTLICPL